MKPDPTERCPVGLHSAGMTALRTQEVEADVGTTKCCGGIMCIILPFSSDVAQCGCTFNNVAAARAVGNTNKQHWL